MFRLFLILFLGILPFIDDCMRKRSSYILWANQFEPTDFPGLVAWWQADDMEFQPVAYRLGDNAGNQNLLTALINNNTAPIYSQTAIGGTPGLFFDNNGVNGDRRLANTTPALWKFLHDGSSCTVFAVVKPTGIGSTKTVIDTTNQSGTGTIIRHDSVNQRWSVTVKNGTTVILSLVTANGSAPTNQIYRVLFTYNEALTPKAALWVNGIKLTGNTSSAPNVGNPSGNLTIGAQLGTGAVFDGYIKTIALYNSVLSDSDIRKLSSSQLLKSPRTLKRIWTVGDSITAGTYQTRLWERGLLSTNYRLDLIGTRTDGFSDGIFLMSDLNHEGWSSLRIDQIHTTVEPIVLDYTPTDIVFIGGTNDVTQNFAQSVIETRLQSCVAMLLAKYPTATLWLGRPPRILSSHSTQMETWASYVQSYAISQGINYINTDVANDSEIGPDGGHPNTAGKATQGNRIADALGI